MHNHEGKILTISLYITTPVFNGHTKQQLFKDQINTIFIFLNSRQFVIYAYEQDLVRLVTSVAIGDCLVNLYTNSLPGQPKKPIYGICFYYDGSARSCLFKLAQYLLSLTILFSRR